MILGAKQVFVPHKHCSVASGGCFNQGKCLAQCNAQRRRNSDARICELERRVLNLELALARTGESA